MNMKFKVLVQKENYLNGKLVYAKLASTKYFPYFGYTTQPYLHHYDTTMDSYIECFDNPALIDILKEHHMFITVELTIIE